MCVQDLVDSLSNIHVSYKSVRRRLCVQFEEKQVTQDTKLLSALYKSMSN